MCIHKKPDSLRSFWQENYFPEKLSVSHGNIKMGETPSVSLLPGVTCAANVPCLTEGCYACKLCRLRPSVREAYTRNTRLYANAPACYFLQLSDALRMHRFFRLHVSGDFPDAHYFSECCRVIAENPHCIVLAFTKQFAIVNDYIANGGTIPENFRIVFSNWGSFRAVNPHRFPETEVIFKNTDVPDNWKICPGNCADCACRNTGCWTLEPGETIAFKKH